MTTGSIEVTILSLPVSGVNVVPGTFRDQLPHGPVIVYFLRHFG